MPEFFDALPGQEVPVGGISAGFKKIWEDTPAKESRAVQLNLVLHLGRNSSAADALVQFQNTLNFAHRYPCRVVVLCPDYEETSPPEMRAKIYGECHLGKSKSDKRTNRVRQTRIERMMSKAELARRAGLSVLTIDRVEKGLGCRMDTKRKILEALGLTLADRIRVFGEEE